MTQGNKNEIILEENCKVSKYNFRNKKYIIIKAAMRVFTYLFNLYNV